MPNHVSGNNLQTLWREKIKVWIESNFYKKTETYSKSEVYSKDEVKGLFVETGNTYTYTGG